MPGPYDDWDDITPGRSSSKKTTPSVTPYDEWEDITPASEPVDSSFGSGYGLPSLQDIYSTALKIPGQLIETGVGAIDYASTPWRSMSPGIPTLSKYLKENTSYDPEGWEKEISEKEDSERLKNARQELGQAEGIGGTAASYWRNPGLAALDIEASAVPMMMGGVAGRGIKAATGLGPLISGALGEGGLTAAQLTADITREKDDFTPADFLTTTGSAATTAAISGAGGRVANRLNLPDVDQLLADPTRKGTRRILPLLGAGASEALEEGGQSYQEQVATNIATGKPWSEGAGGAAVSGMVSGGLMGGGMPMFRRGAPTPPPDGTVPPPDDGGVLGEDEEFTGTSFEIPVAEATEDFVKAIRENGFVQVGQSPNGKILFKRVDVVDDDDTDDDGDGGTPVPPPDLPLNEPAGEAVINAPFGQGTVEGAREGETTGRVAQMPASATEALTDILANPGNDPLIDQKANDFQMRIARTSDPMELTRLLQLIQMHPRQDAITRGLADMIRRRLNETQPEMNYQAPPTPPISPEVPTESGVEDLRQQAVQSDTFSDEEARAILDRAMPQPGPEPQPATEYGQDPVDQEIGAWQQGQDEILRQNQEANGPLMGPTVIKSAMDSPPERTTYSIDPDEMHEVNSLSPRIKVTQDENGTHLFIDGKEFNVWNGGPTAAEVRNVEALLADPESHQRFFQLRDANGTGYLVPQWKRDLVNAELNPPSVPLDENGPLVVDDAGKAGFEALPESEQPPPVTDRAGLDEFVRQVQSRVQGETGIPTHPVQVDQRVREALDRASEPPAVPITPAPEPKGRTVIIRKGMLTPKMLDNLNRSGYIEVGKTSDGDSKFMKEDTGLNWGPSVSVQGPTADTLQVQIDAFTQQNQPDIAYKSLTAKKNARLKKGETWRSRAEAEVAKMRAAEVPSPDLELNQTPAGERVLRHPTAIQWMARVKELDARNAPDTAYRDIASTLARNPLKKGDTWRKVILGAIDYFESRMPPDTDVAGMAKPRGYVDPNPDVHKRYEVYDENDQLIDKTYDHDEAQRWADENNGYVKDTGSDDISRMAKPFDPRIGSGVGQSFEKALRDATDEDLTRMRDLMIGDVDKARQFLARVGHISNISGVAKRRVRFAEGKLTTIQYEQEIRAREASIQSDKLAADEEAFARQYSGAPNVKTTGEVIRQLRLLQNEAYARGDTDEAARIGSDLQEIENAYRTKRDANELYDRGLLGKEGRWWERGGAEDISRMARSFGEGQGARPGETTGRVAPFGPRKGTQVYQLVEEISNELKKGIPDNPRVETLLNQAEALIMNETDPEIIKDNFHSLEVSKDYGYLNNSPDEIELFGILRDAALDKLRQGGAEDISRMRVPGPVNPKTGRSNIVMGGADPAVLDMLGTALYNRDAIATSVKELGQNAVDERKISGNKEPIRILFSEYAEIPGRRSATGAKVYGTSIVVKDFGRGLTPEQLYTIFTDVGKSGKRDEASASGGFGFAKAAPLLGGLYVKVESIVNENGKLVSYEFEGDPNQMKDQATGVPLHRTEVTKKGAKTGFEVQVLFPQEKSLTKARNLWKTTIENSPNMDNVQSFYSTSSVDWDDDIPEFFDKGTVSNPKNPNKVVEHKSLPIPTYVNTMNLPSSNVKVHYDINPNEERTMMEVIVLNNGLFALDFSKGVGILPLPNLPEKIVLDVNSLVKEGTDGYPFGLNREEMDDEVKDQIDKWLNDNVVSPSRNQKTSEVQKLFDDLKPASPLHVHVLHDSGDRMTAKEKANFNNSPHVRKVADIMGKMLDELRDMFSHAQGNAEGDTIAFGFLQADSKSGGLNIPNPSISGWRTRKEYKILINLMGTIRDAPSPGGAAEEIAHVILHEFNHNRVRNEGGGFTWALKETDSRYTAGRRADIVEEIYAAITGPDGDYAPGIRSLLQEYTAARGRPDTTVDILSRQRASEHIRKPEGQEGVPSDGERDGKKATPRAIEVFRKGLPIVDSYEKTMFILPDGTRLGFDPKVIQYHDSQARALGIPLGEAQEAGIIRFRGQVAEVHGPISGEQATHLADSTWNRESPSADPYIDVDVMKPDGRRERETFTENDSPRKIRDWVNKFFQNFEKGWTEAKKGDTTGSIFGGMPFSQAYAGVKQATGWGMGPTPPPPKPKKGQLAQKQVHWIKEALAVPSGLTTTADISAPFRQGLSQIHTPQFWKAVWPMLKAGRSEQIFNQIDADLRSKLVMQPKVNRTTGKISPSIAQEAGLKMFESASSNAPMGQRAQATASRWIEQGIGQGIGSQIWRNTAGIPIRASNRAYITFLNHLKVNRFEHLMMLSSKMAAEAKATGYARPGIFKQAYTPAESVQLNGFRNKMLAKELADFVNTATGQGPLKTHILPFKQTEVSLESATEALSHIFFSPGLIASRVRMLNPNTYVMASPMVRRQYMMAALATGTAWMSALALIKGGGGDEVEVNLENMTSADWAKAKIGDTRMDPGGGFQQFLVAMARMIQGGTTSSASNEWREFGEGFNAPTQKGNIERFLSNKFNPVTKFAYDLASQSEYNPFHVYDRIAQLFTPLVIQDLVGLYYENPKLLPWMLPIMTGMGTQTYGRGESVGKLVAPENDWLATGGGVVDLYKDEYQFD